MISLSAATVPPRCCSVRCFPWPRTSAPRALPVVRRRYGAGVAVVCIFLPGSVARRGGTRRLESGCASGPRVRAALAGVNAGAVGNAPAAALYNPVLTGALATHEDDPAALPALRFRGRERVSWPRGRQFVRARAARRRADRRLRHPGAHRVRTDVSGDGLGRADRRFDLHLAGAAGLARRTGRDDVTAMPTSVWTRRRPSAWCSWSWDRHFAKFPRGGVGSHRRRP